jgi:hypothetical protein
MQTGSTYEWDVASSTSTDVINVTTGGSNNGNLILGNMTIKVKDAGVTTPIVSTDQLPVFTYETGAQAVVRSIGTVTIDISGLGVGWSGTPTLVDNGTGTIYITGLSKSASGFDTWKTTNSATGTLAGDHDGDGVANGVEFFLYGLNGNSTGFTSLPGIVKDPGTGVLSVTWPKGSGYTGVYPTDFVVETSETLTGTWIAETVGGTVTNSSTEVKYTFPMPLGAKKFVRLVVK